MASKKNKTLAAIVALSALVVADATLNTAYEGHVTQVVDGDNVKVELLILPSEGLTWTVNVRALGIDTPELRRPDKTCHDGGVGEKKLAQIAKSLIEAKLPVGTKVRVTDLSAGKYAGRALGLTWFRQNDEVISTSQLLTDRKLAVEYWGGKKSSWCNAYEKWKAAQ